MTKIKRKSGHISFPLAFFRTRGRKEDDMTLFQDYIGCPVTLIGLGGIGSNLVPLIVRMGVLELHLWDSDLVERVNLPTQDHVSANIGRSKVRSAAETARRINPELEIECHERFFSSE